MRDSFSVAAVPTPLKVMCGLFLRQPGCQADGLTRGFASSLCNEFAFIGKEGPNVIAVYSKPYRQSSEKLDACYTWLHILFVDFPRFSSVKHCSNLLCRFALH